MAEIGQNILKAAHLLMDMEVIAIPTETVYGLAANALNADAVTKIFEIKNRPVFDPLIIHVADFSCFSDYTLNVPRQINDFVRNFCPGPITFLLEKKQIIPDLVTAGHERVAIRIPNHALTLELLKNLNFPLAAPSANPFGYVSPTNPQHVNDQLGDKISYILDGGQCEIGIESTIIGFEQGILKIFRKGGVTMEEIKKMYSGEILVQEHSSSNPAAPGMLKKHYAPNKKILIYNQQQIIGTDKIGFLGFQKFISHIPTENQFLLSPNGNMKEAAQRLFLGLRWLDALNIDTIYIETVPEEGLGIAINDKLKRAAAVDI